MASTRTHRQPFLGATSAALVASMLLAGCSQVTGGGFMRSAGLPDAKATFGLALTCNDNGYLVGHWVYHDRGAANGVRVHGRVTESLARDRGLTCDPLAAEPGGDGTWLDMPYRSQGPPTRRGWADLVVHDGDSGGPAQLKGDRLSITLYRASDGHVWYRNQGRVRGGNLKVIES